MIVWNATWEPVVIKCRIVYTYYFLFFQKENNILFDIIVSPN